MRGLLILSLVFLNDMACSQSAKVFMGARGAGMGNVTSVLHDEGSLFNNVGALAGNSYSAFFAYEANAILPGANRMATGILLPSKAGVLGMGLSRFGDELYNEQFASLGFGNQLGIASLGIKVNYIQYHADGYENRNAFTFDFGGLAQITKQISVGAYIVNLNQAEIAPGERLPTRLVAGLGLKLEDNFFFTTEVDKDINFSATWKAGFEYALKKRVFFRSGFNLNPNTINAGLGARIKKLKVDYALVFNNTLGDTHQASAILRLGKEASK